MFFANWQAAANRSTRLAPGSDQLAANDNLLRSSQNGVIVFAAISVEAFVNYMAGVGQLDHHRQFEARLGTLDKWRIYPKLLFDDYLPEHILDRIKRVVALRNQVAHPKFQATSIDELNDRSAFGDAHGYYIINTIHHTARAIEELSKSRFKADWIRPDFNGELSWSGRLFLV